MKTRNIDLEHNSLLTNHIFKHIILEAPTISELEKKIKNYKALLITIITNAYRITNLTLEHDGNYNFLPNQNYQTGISFNFNGKRKDTITHPEATLHHLKQLTALESKKHQSSQLVKSLHVSSKEVCHADTILIEADSEAKMDDAISNKQRTFIEHLMSDTNLTNISFITKSKIRDPKTNKITITMAVRYKTRETIKKHDNNDDNEQR